MPRTKNQPVSQPSSSSSSSLGGGSKLIILVAVVIIAVIVGGIYWWQKNATETIKKDAQDKINQLKNEVVDLNKNVGELSETQKLIAAVKDCSAADKNGGGILIDDSISQILGERSNELASDLKQGYMLDNLCEVYRGVSAADKVFMFLKINNEAYNGLADKPEEQKSAAAKVVIGVTDTNYQKFDFYYLEIADYNREFCNFDGMNGQKIMYYCTAAVPGETDINWYIYDIGNKVNTLVKKSVITLPAGSSKATEKTEIIEEKLLQDYEMGN